jgi:hypothetical protein
MAFCAICGRDHEPGPCVAVGDPHAKVSPRQFQQTKRAADRIMLLIGACYLAVLGIAVLLYLLVGQH